MEAKIIYKPMCSACGTGLTFTALECPGCKLLFNRNILFQNPLRKCKKNQFKDKLKSWKIRKNVLKTILLKSRELKDVLLHFKRKNNGRS